MYLTAKKIIVLFFGLGSNHPLSLEEIGEKFSLTRERVRQIQLEALAQLRRLIKRRGVSRDVLF